MIQSQTSDGFTIAWRQVSASPAIGVSYRQGDGPVTAAPIECGALNRCRALLAGLSSDESCQYQVVERSDEESRVLASGTVEMPPGRNEPFRFIAFGDSGSDDAGQWAVAEKLEAAGPDLLIHTGDVVYPRGHYSDYPAKFYRPYGNIIRNVPIFPTIGNHDYYYDHGESYLGEFSLPENGPPGTIPERHYYFDYGDVRFVCIDSNETFGALRDFVVPWMRERLADAGDRWTVVYFHHATFTHGKNTPLGSIRSLVVPVIDETAVDLVLTGHNHMYERSLPIRDGNAVQDGKGTVYITTGAGGAELQPYSGPKPDYLVKDDNTVFSFTIIDVTPAALNIQQVTSSGEKIDEFEISRVPDSQVSPTHGDAMQAPTPASPSGSTPETIQAGHD